MKRARQRSEIKAAIAVVLFAAFIGIAPAIGNMGFQKPIAVGDFDYSIAVPLSWEENPNHDIASVTLHMNVLSGGRVQGCFAVHVHDRADADQHDWIDYHKKSNVPQAYGPSSIATEKWISAGSCDAWLMHIPYIANQRSYALLEALVFTPCHVLILSYLYEHGRASKASLEMNRILASFCASPNEAAEARDWYPEGRTLSLERFGLFLRLPIGWLPDQRSNKRNLVAVDLPSAGKLHVVTVQRAAKGMEGLERCIRKAVKGWKCKEVPNPIAFGFSQTEALWYESTETGSVAVLGLHGTGGFGLVMIKPNPKERALLRKMALQALLIDPDDAKEAKRLAMTDFKEALRANDTERVALALKTLELFPSDKSVAKLVARGLDAAEEVQALCVASLGRLGSKTASGYLEKILSNRRALPSVREKCIEALSCIGGRRELMVLKKVERSAGASMPSALRTSLKNAICRQPVAQRTGVRAGWIKP